MRKQYHFRKVKEDIHIWDVDRLIKLSEGLNEIEVNLKKIKELDENYWFQNKNEIPSIKKIAGHIKLTENTDLKYPIILSADGRVMDGMHRVLKAFLNQNKTIRAKKFQVTPEPDFLNIAPKDLKYD